MDKSKDEIYDQIYEAKDNNGKFKGMSYEDGVIAALEWVLGEEEETPMED